MQAAVIEALRNAWVTPVADVRAVSLFRQAEAKIGYLALEELAAMPAAEVVQLFA